MKNLVLDFFVAKNSLYSLCGSDHNLDSQGLKQRFLWHFDLHPILLRSTVQTCNSCTSGPDLCQCLVVRKPMENAKHINDRHSLWGHLCIYTQGTWLQLGRAVVYYTWAAHAFSAGIKCWHCICQIQLQNYICLCQLRICQIIKISLKFTVCLFRSRCFLWISNNKEKENANFCYKTTCGNVRRGFVLDVWNFYLSSLFYCIFGLYYSS